MLRICCALLLGTLGAFGQAPNSQDAVWLTGRAWILMPDTVKVFYVTGLRDGMAIASYALPAEARELMTERTQAKGFNPGDYVKEFDKLFAERENLNIVLPLAYQYVTVKLKGATTSQDLEQQLIQLRRMMAK